MVIGFFVGSLLRPTNLWDAAQNTENIVYIVWYQVVI